MEGRLTQRKRVLGQGNRSLNRWVNLRMGKAADSPVMKSEIDVGPNPSSFHFLVQSLQV